MLKTNTEHPHILLNVLYFSL